MNNLALKKETLSEGTFSGAINAAGFDIKSIASKPDGYDLTIRGFMAPGWTGRLTAALAEHRIGIVRGKAERVTISSWHSNFELKSPTPLANPLGIDYIALAGKELPSDRKVEKISLMEYVMEPASRHGGSLYVEVTGVDRLGFLGDLLDYFSMRCLFPVKMSVETVAGMAVDRFWLRGIGGSVPSEAITGAVKDNLESLLMTKGNA